MRYAVVLLIALAFFSIETKGSNSVDSLKQVLNTTNNDYEKASVFLDLTIELTSENNKEALNYAFDGLKLAEKLHDSVKTSFYDNIGEIYRDLGEFDKAIEYLNTGLSIKQKNNNLKDIAISYNKLGKVYVNQTEYDKSIEYFIKAVKIMEQLENLEGQGFYLNNIGIVYDLQKMYDKALEYYKLSLKIKEEINHDAGVAATTNNIAIVYFNLNEYRKSLEYHKRALELNIKLNRQKPIARSHNNIGFALIFLNKNQQALEHLFIALKMRKKMEDNVGIATTLNNIGRAYLNNKQPKEAEKYCLESLEFAKKIKSNDLLKNAYLLLSEINESKNNNSQALNYYKLYSDVKDSILTIENADALAEAEAKYQNEKKEVELQKQNLIIEKQNHDIELESNKRKLFLSLLIGACLVLIFAGIGYFQKRRINLLLKAQNILIENKNLSLEKDKAAIDKELQDKSEILNRVYSEKREQELPHELLSLSQREMEVLSYLALGWTDNEIAEKLFVSKSTIKTHLRRIYSKLLVKGRAEAVSIAHKYNIIGGV